MKRFGKPVISLKLHVIIICCALTMIFLGLQPAVPAAQADDSLKESSRQLLHNYLMKDNGKALYSATSLGDAQKYDRALDEVKVVIDPALGPRAKYDPNTLTVYLSKDPRAVDESEKESWGNSIWHELTHRLEDSNGDKDGDTDWNERNIEYMTHVADTALNYLRKMEEKAESGATGAELKKYWEKFLESMEKAKKLTAYQPDPEVLKKWFGFDVDVDKIRRHYASGRCGQALQEAVTPSTAQAGSGGASGVFPAEPFNGMQITYSVSGASITGSNDSLGFTTSRTLSGDLGSGELLVSGSAKMGNGYGADLKVTVSVDGQSKDYSAYIESGFPGFNEQSFNVSVPIPAGAKTGNISICMTGHYNVGTRGLEVSGSFNAPAAPTQSTGGIGVILNGAKVQFDVPPVIESGRTLVPLRKIAEALGCNVNWNDATKTILLEKGNMQVYLQVNSTTAKVNGKTKKLDVPPRITQGRTLLPLRFLAEELGLKVGYDKTSQTITISR